MSQFKWTKRREIVALTLAQGYTIEKAAEMGKVTMRTVHRWKKNIEFLAEVDRLSLMVGIASRAERLRISMQVARQKIKDGEFDTARDLLDWLKFAQSETDGAKFDLALIFEAMEAETTDRSEASNETGMDADTGQPAS